MESIRFHYFRSIAPVFVDLRGELYEVARHVCSGKCTVGALGENAVEGMTKLMEEGLYIIHRKEGGLTGSRLIEIAYVYDNRTMIYTVVVDILAYHIIHPCARTLGCAREVIGDEDSEQIAFCIRNLEGFALGVIHGYTAYRLNIDAIQAMSEVEHTLAHVRELEIRLEFFFVNGILQIAETLRIEPPIPGLQFSIFRRIHLYEACLDVFVEKLLEGGTFTLGSSE